MQAHDLWLKIGEKLGLCEPPGIALAAPGEVSLVEVARSGDFMDMNRRPVKLTPEGLTELASTFDAERDHKIKLGHGRITSETPDYGDITGLQYDAQKDRLLASVKPTEALVEKNRKGAFRRVSMELGIPAEGKFSFEHLALLGAKRPAVSGLAPVALAEGDPVVVCAMAADDDTDPDASWMAQQREVAARLSEEAKEEIKQSATAAKEVDMSEEIQTENKALKTRLAAFAASDVTTFMGSDAMKKRIPVGVADKVSRILTALASFEAEGNGATVKLSESETETPLYEAIKAVLASWPEKLSEAETKEIAANGTEPPEVDMAQFAGADRDSVKRHLAAMTIQAEEAAKGNKINYIESVRLYDARQIAK